MLGNLENVGNYFENQAVFLSIDLERVIPLYSFFAIMKHRFTKLCAAFALLTSSLLCRAQGDYANDRLAEWQQKVDYKIEVTLDDSLNILNGFITMDYKNNSPQTLEFIYMHLWPNAYWDLASPLSEQMLENGKTKLWYSKPSQRGFMDKLDFKLNAEVCKWEYTVPSNEICKLLLNKPLKPGESVRISTPFRVKLPETFSRMGHIGQSYQVTQWYPKPAVLDKSGWHPIPYLDQGEFYSEFGTFDVSITLPKNYVVGATGDLQDSSEIKWMDARADEGKKTEHWFDDNLSFPPSSRETKTIRFTQKNIHDFGWFADKRYHVLKGEVTLPYTKRKVTTWALFTNNQAEMWSKAPEYLHDAIQYYSLWIGEYPYNQVTAVDGTISAGSGMEYPNVTVIGTEKNAFALDDVITHEVGHNWFYGMLGSNERDHAWMDEGINSYYEFRYLRTKYPNKKLLEPDILAKLLDVSQYKHQYELDIAYQFLARENNDEPIEQTSSRFTEINYAAMVYGKSALIFSYMEAYLGSEKFDSVMKKYFETWKYKHPQPEDLRKIFETETHKDLSWFFDDLLGTTKKIDYKIDCVNQHKKDNNDSITVELKNVNQIASPVCITLMKKDSIMYSKWIDGFNGTKTISLPKLNADKIQIDPDLLIPEINRKNNTYKLNKLAHHFQKLKLQFLVAAENQNRTQILFAPYIGWNNYDKFQVGLAFYNPFVPGRKFTYLFVPAIGTGSKTIIGFAKMAYHFYPETVQSFSIGIAAKRFSYIHDPTPLQFNKLEPYINIEMKKKNSRSPFTQTLNIRTVIAFLNVTNPLLLEDNSAYTKTTERYAISEMHYRVERNSTLHPFDFNLTLQQGKDFMGLMAEGHFKVSYKLKNQGLFIRVFAGGFPVYTKSSSDLTAPLPRLYLSNGTTYNFAYWLQRDYMLDENYFDRNGHLNFFEHQVSLTGGAFRSVTDFGSTSKFLAAVNISSTIYRYVPIRPFVSMGALIDDLKQPNFAAEFGLSVVVLKDLFEINLPIVTTKNISDNQKILGITKWYQKASFTLKIKFEKPINLIRQAVGL